MIVVIVDDDDDDDDDDGDGDGDGGGGGVLFQSEIFASLSMARSWSILAGLREDNPVDWSKS